MSTPIGIFGGGDEIMPLLGHSRVGVSGARVMPGAA